MEVQEELDRKHLKFICTNIQIVINEFYNKSIFKDDKNFLTDLLKKYFSFNVNTYSKDCLYFKNFFNLVYSGDYIPRIYILHSLGHYTNESSVSLISLPAKRNFLINFLTCFLVESQRRNETLPTHFSRNFLKALCFYSEENNDDFLF